MPTDNLRITKIICSVFTVKKNEQSDVFIANFEPFSLRF